MSVPDLPHISSFLRDLTFSKPSEPGYALLTVAESGVARDERGRDIYDKGVDLWWRPVGAFSIESLIARVNEELAKRGHANTKRLAALFIGFYAVSTKRATHAVQALNELFDRIEVSRLRQFFVIPVAAPHGIKPFTFGSFTVGPMNAERIKQLTLQAGSPDYFARYHPYLRGKYVIEHAERACTIVNLEGYIAPRSSVLLTDGRTEQLLERLVDEYYQVLSATYAEQFWSALDADQQLQVCFGAPYIDVRNVRLIINTEMLSVYQNPATGRGYVAPTVGHPKLELASADRKVPIVLEDLRRDFGFKGYKDTELDRMIKMLVKYMFRGKLRAMDRDFSDAFLSHVIALDLLFGERNSSVELVSRRVAVLAHRKLRVSASVAKKTVENLYGTRSRYVHQGKEIREEAVEEVERLCSEALSSLLRVRRLDSGSSEPVFIEKWLKKLDYFWGAFEADRPVDSEELTAIGIE